MYVHVHNVHYCPVSNYFQLFADRPAFRGPIKNKAADITSLRYDFYPEECFENQQGQIDYIADAIEKLVKKGQFLKGGRDMEVCPNNLRRNDSEEYI